MSKIIHIDELDMKLLIFVQNVMNCERQVKGKLPVTWYKLTFAVNLTLTVSILTYNKTIGEEVFKACSVCSIRA